MLGVAPSASFCASINCAFAISSSSEMSVIEPIM